MFESGASFLCVHKSPTDGLHKTDTLCIADLHCPMATGPTPLCLLTQPVGMASKSSKAAENVYAPLVMVSLGAR